VVLELRDTSRKEAQDAHRISIPFAFFALFCGKYSCQFEKNLVSWSFHRQARLQNISRPVAGTAGDLFPGLLVDLVSVLLNRKFLSERRAAKHDCFSTDAKLDFLAANLALHGNLVTNTGVSSKAA